MIIQGINYDEKSSFLRGSALAPPIIRATRNNGAHNFYAENGKKTDVSSVIDNGDFDIDDYFDIEKITEVHLYDTSKILTLGGDHSITYPIIRAFSHVYPDLTILHFDAHTDMYNSYQGDPYSHACPFARIMEEELVENLIQVGIRTMIPQQREQIYKYDVQSIEMKNFTPAFRPQIEGPVYISLDMDVFDPAFAPGVSHQEPGGMTPRQVINFLHSLNVEVVGADIVEFNPIRDVQGITASLAAKMMKELIGKMLTPKRIDVF